MISPGKMKLMLTKSDLDKYELNTNALDGEDSLVKQSFRELLDDVKRVSGFDASDDKVFIQLYPSRDGGAEIYITRLTQRRDEKRALHEKTVRVGTVYAFLSLGDMIEACARFSDEDLPEFSSGWYGEGMYFLLTESQIPYSDSFHRRKIDKSLQFVGDYGKIIERETAEFYVKEHCLCFCEKNAVKMLGSMV